MAHSQPSPSFFIILIDHSAPHVEIPRDFVKKHLKNKIPKDPIIRSANGGYYWNLKIKKIGEKYCFSHGWNNVVKDINLGFGDFLYFKMVDKSTFKMFVFGVNACEKFLPPKIIVEVDDVSEDVVVLDDDMDDDEDEDDEVDDEYDDEYEVDGDDDDDEDDIDGDIDDEDGDPFFTITITTTHKRIMRLKSKFVGLVGIDGERAITIKNGDGEEWRMVLRVEDMYKRYYLTSGWCKFLRNNDLSEGDKCVFKFVTREDKLCLAKVTKKRRAAAQRPLVSARRENPTKEALVEPHGGDEWEDVNGDPLFSMVISTTHIYVLRLPRKFVELAGLGGERAIKLKSHDGKEWKMGLRADKVANGRYCLSAGWQKFKRAHNLSEGDICVFKYIKIEDKLCLVKVYSKDGSSGEGVATKVLSRGNGGVNDMVVKRGRRRPRKH